MLLIALKKLIKKYTEIERQKASMQAIQAVIRATRCSVYIYEVEQADKEDERMEALAHACESRRVADPGDFVLVHRILPGNKPKLKIETTNKVSASLFKQILAKTY